jgi:hypothetical protein
MFRCFPNVPAFPPRRRSRRFLVTFWSFFSLAASFLSIPWGLPVSGNFLFFLCFQKPFRFLKGFFPLKKHSRFDQPKQKKQQHWHSMSPSFFLAGLLTLLAGHSALADLLEADFTVDDGAFSLVNFDS